MKCAAPAALLLCLCHSARSAVPSLDTATRLRAGRTRAYLTEAKTDDLQTQRGQKGKKAPVVLQPQPLRSQELVTHGEADHHEVGLRQDISLCSLAARDSEAGS